jgi:5-methylcytosine-specific restriction endonuclease McrA
MEMMEIKKKSSTWKKDETLNMPFGTANGRLYRLILFDLVKRCGADTCYRCKKKIEKSSECSIEHKKPWEGISADLFWDLENIAFSHKRCNIAAGHLGKATYNSIRTIGIAPDGMAWCSRHQDWIPKGRFHKDGNKETGLRDYCIDCRKIRGRNS